MQALAFPSQPNDHLQERHLLTRRFVSLSCTCWSPAEKGIKMDL